MSESEENLGLVDGKAKVNTNNKLSLFDAICFVYSNIIGIGIFMSVSDTFKVFANSSICMVLIFWIIGSMMSIFGALCYAELGRRYPSSGGEIVYYQNNLNQKFSVVFAIMYCFLIKPLTIAAISITASTYLVDAVVTNNSHIDLIRKLVAISILVLSCILNCISKLVATKAGVFFMILKSSLLLIIIVFGVIFMCKGDFNDWKNPFVLVEFCPVHLSVAFINIFWAFEGWSSLSLVAGDVTNANRNLPISIFVGVFCVAIMYILTVISYFVVIGFDGVRLSQTVGITFSKVALKKAHLVIPVLVFFSGIGSLNGNMYATSETMKSASEMGILPKVFSLIHIKSRVPILSLIIILLFSTVFMFLKFQVLLSYCAFVTWVFYFLSFCCLWVAKIKERKSGKVSKGFSINYVFIVIIQLVCLFVISMCFYLTLYGCITILGVMIFIYCIQYMPRKNKFFEKLSEFDEKLAKMFEKFGLVEEEPKKN